MVDLLKFISLGESSLWVTTCLGIFHLCWSSILTLFLNYSLFHSIIHEFSEENVASIHMTTRIVIILLKYWELSDAWMHRKHEFLNDNMHVDYQSWKKKKPKWCTSKLWLMSVLYCKFCVIRCRQKLLYFFNSFKSCNSVTWIQQLWNWSCFSERKLAHKSQMIYDHFITKYGS